MGNRRITAFPITESGVIGYQDSSQAPVTVHNMLLTETGGTTAETVKLYVPKAGEVASADGTLVATVTVPKSSTLSLHGLDYWFPNGVYAACSGGTLAGTVGIS